MTILIELDNVSKAFGAVKALCNVDLRICEGISALIGPNGSGKSSTIRIVLGLIKADSGRVRVFGHDPWKEGEVVRHRMGVLHEKPEFPRWATAFQLASMVAEIKKVKKPERESKAMLRLFGLENAMDRKISTYSAGMVQRLGLALALVGAPELVILDEPTANLDPDGRRDVLELMKRMYQDHGISFLISSHILSELQRLCQHVAIMSSGSIMEEGKLDELASEYCLWARKLRCESPEKKDKVLGCFKGASEIVINGDSLVIRSCSREWLEARVDHIISSGLMRTSDIEEVQDILESLYAEVTTRKQGRSPSPPQEQREK